jgi:hypothetical protein
MADWVYPINETGRGGAWNGGPVLDYFSTATRDDAWFLGNCFRQIAERDRIWAFATKPYERVVGVGAVSRGPYWHTWPNGSDGYAIDIEWDLDRNERIVKAGLTGVLDPPWRTQRALRPAELRRLASWQPKHAAPTSGRGKRKRLAEVTDREGQPDFRSRLMLAYGGACAISGCGVPDALQAAHIQPYDGPYTNLTGNGLLLRADLHNLFDKGLVWIDAQYRVHVDRSITDAAYRAFHLQALRLPSLHDDAPDQANLREHRREFGRQQLIRKIQPSSARSRTASASKRAPQSASWPAKASGTNRS